MLTPPCAMASDEEFKAFSIQTQRFYIYNKPGFVLVELPEITNDVNFTLSLVKPKAGLNISIINHSRIDNTHYYIIEINITKNTGGEERGCTDILVGLQLKLNTSDGHNQTELFFITACSEDSIIGSYLVDRLVGLSNKIDELINDTRKSISTLRGGGKDASEQAFSLRDSRNILLLLNTATLAVVVAFFTYFLIKTRAKDKEFSVLGL